jgi:hypothetical protein
MTQSPEPGRPSSSPVVRADLLRRIHGCALPKLAELLREALDSVDDALFAMAEKATSNAEQARHFDGMRETRRRRGDIEHRFQERLVQGLVEFAEGRARRNSAERTEPAVREDLSLIENEELEQSLAVTGMVSRAEGKLARPLYALNRRLSVLAADSEVDEESNPLAPAALAAAFRSGIEGLDCAQETRLILLKLFERMVIEALEPVYSELNDLLKDAGILPKVPMPITAREEREPAPVPVSDAAAHAGEAPETGPMAPAAMPRAAAVPMSAGTPGALGGSGATTEQPGAAAGFDEQEGSSPFSDEVYRSIYTLMAARRTARHYAANAERYESAAPAGDSPQVRLVVDVADLLSALTLLQGDFSSADESPVGADQVKAQLLQRVSNLGVDAEKSAMRPRDEHSIDLVGMVFDYILQDQNLPPVIQVLLARLQIPYIKVALLDPRFFAMRSHPARRLLDELSQAGLGWSEASDPDRRLYERIRGVVDTILRDFDDNLALFDRLLVNFRGFIAAERRRAEVAEQRAAEATRGRERLLGARRRAAREVLERVRGRDLPRVSHTVLTRPWANFMVLTMLRQGEDSQAWRDALRFADDLVWASEPRTEPAERERLLAMIPQLDRMLRHGLSTVAYHDSDIQKLSAELIHMLESQADPDAEHSPPQVDTDIDLHLPDEPLVQPLDTSLDDGAGNSRSDDQRTPLHQAWIERARDLTIGTWVEFRNDAGVGERARLSWTSPVSGRHLFVNHKGLKVCDRSPEQLGEELAGDAAVIIESSALVDRALATILDRLRQQSVTH